MINERANDSKLVNYHPYRDVFVAYIISKRKQNISGREFGFWQVPEEDQERKAGGHLKMKHVDVAIRGSKCTEGVDDVLLTLIIFVDGC